MNWSYEALITLTPIAPLLISAILMAGGLGAPIPSTLLVVASGVLVRQGLLAPETAVLGWLFVISGFSSVNANKIQFSRRLPANRPTVIIC